MLKKWHHCTFMAHIDIQYLVLQNKDEDVVSSHGEHQEGNDLKDDQWGGYANPGIKTHWGQDRAGDHQDPTQTNQKLRVHLQDKEMQMYKRLSEPIDISLLRCSKNNNPDIGILYQLLLITYSRWYIPFYHFFSLYRSQYNPGAYFMLTFLQQQLNSCFSNLKKKRKAPIITLSALGQRV